MTLSVVVPTFNQAGLLEECLGALTAQTLPAGAFEVVVVDDGSTDDTPEVIRRHAARAHIVPVRLPENRGRSAARNAGVRRARGEIVVFVDSDVIVTPVFLEAHGRVHAAHGSGVLSRGPVIVVPDAAAARRARVPPLVFSAAYLDTANAGLGREMLERAGLFDEGFPGYGWEDLELGVRLRQLGVRRIFTRRAAAFHVQPAPRPDALPLLLSKEEERARSAAYFYARHPTPGTRFLIQASPLHRVAFWLLSAGGTITERNVTTIGDRLRRAGAPALAFLALRSVLNRHYMRTLQRAWRGA